MPGYKRLYLLEKARADRMELELRQANEDMRAVSLRNLADMKRSLDAALETIATLRKSAGGGKS